MHCVFISALDSLVLSKFLAEHITDQFRILILVTPCWMEAAWLPKVIGMLEDIPHYYIVIKNLMDVSVDWCSRFSNHCI